jgi:hypothetical protein
MEKVGRKTAYAILRPSYCNPRDLEMVLLENREEVKAYLNGTLIQVRPDVEGVRPELADIAFLIASARHAKITRGFHGPCLVIEYDESKYLSFFKNI